MNFDMNTYVLLLDPVLHTVLISKSEVLHQYFSRILITIITYDGLKYAEHFFSKIAITVSAQKKFSTGLFLVNLRINK